MKIMLAFHAPSVYTAPALRCKLDGGRSSAVEPRIVVPVVVGSNPIVHP